MRRTIAAVPVLLCLLMVDWGRARAQKDGPPGLAPAVRAEGGKLLGDWQWREGASSMYLRVEPPVQRKDGRWTSYYLYFAFINKAAGRPPRRKAWYYGPADIVVRPKAKALVPLDAEQVKKARAPARLHYDWMKDDLELTIPGGFWKGTYRLKKVPARE
jgi:hypothetical protein